MVVNRFVLFLVRYVFTVRATLHEKNTYDMSLGQFLTSGSCLIAAFFENVRELVIAKVVRNNRHSLRYLATLVFGEAIEELYMKADQFINSL